MVTEITLTALQSRRDQTRVQVMYARIPVKQPKGRDMRTDNKAQTRTTTTANKNTLTIARAGAVSRRARKLSLPSPQGQEGEKGTNPQGDFAQAARVKKLDRGRLTLAIGPQSEGPREPDPVAPGAGTNSTPGERERDLSRTQKGPQDSPGEAAAGPPKLLQRV